MNYTTEQLLQSLQNDLNTINTSLGLEEGTNFTNIAQMAQVGDITTGGGDNSQFLATVQGTNVNTYPTFNEKVNEFKIGKISTQEGTPSQGSPKPISMITSDINVKIKGKNLFDKSILVNKDFDTGSGALLTYNSKILINEDFITLPNGIYTLTLGYVNQAWLLTYDENGNYIYTTAGWITDNKYIFTITDNKKIRFGFNRTINGVRQDISKNDVTVQIESGDIGTDYVEYVENNITIPFTNNYLAGINTTMDELIIDSEGHLSLNRKIDKIDSYNGETITTEYMSTTGALTTGATVIYVKDTPQLIDLETTINMTLYNDVNNFTNDKEALMTITCIHDIKKTYELKNNKTTVLSETSTNNQYPTAKAVFDNISTKFNSYKLDIASDSPMQFYKMNVGFYTFEKTGSSLCSYRTNYNTIYIDRGNGSAYITISGYPILLNYYQKVENKIYTTNYYFASLLYFENSTGALSIINLYKGANTTAINYSVGTSITNWPATITPGNQTFYGTKTYYAIPQVYSYTTPTYNTQLTAKKYVDDQDIVVLNNIAPQYTTTTYNVGDYVIYNKILYVCNTEITTAESWNASHWTQTTIAQMLNS